MEEDGGDLQAQDEGWQLERFLALGLPLEEAERLARAGASWHNVEQLVECGCDPLVAARIAG